MSQALCDFFGCLRLPFDKSLPAKDLYPSNAHQELHARLAFAFQHRFPTLVTGDIGTGKSTALRAFAHSLDRNLYPLAYLANPQLSPATLYAHILRALKIEPAFSFSQLQPQLHNTLLDLSRKNRFLLLVVDEAHLLPPEIFDQLRFLLNAEFDSTSYLSLVLLGQPDLAQKLTFAPYLALQQRIAVRYQLTPFDLEETAAYVKHHLRIAGFQGQLFSDGFIAHLFDHTKGAARHINNVCRAALLLGATEHKKILDESDLKRVILDLDRLLT